MASFDPTGDEPMEDVFLQDDRKQTIAKHATQCQTLFCKYIAMHDILEDPTIMDDQLARFTLWASNMDVWVPQGLNAVSLDYRLRFSSTAADIIHQLLDIICDTLLSLKPIDDRPPHTPSRKRQRISVLGSSEVTRRSNYDDSSDSDSDVDPVEENVLKVTETVGGSITRLFRLSNAVRRSAKANRARKIESYNDKDANKAIDELRDYTRCYIEFRFPQAPDWLLSALIEANAWRLRRLFYQQSHRKRIKMDLQQQSPQTTPSVVQLPKMTSRAPAVRFAPSPLPKPETNKAPVRVPAAPITTATTARQSGLGTVYAKSTTEVPHAKSVLVNNELSFPPMPPDGQCTYCGFIIEFKKTWQNHVIGDLEPFICLIRDCQVGGSHGGGGTGPLTFETSKAWSNHMQTAHPTGHAWECRAPSHDPIIFEDELHYQKHSVAEHGVPEAHVATLSRAARRPILNKVLDCPFGDDFQPPDTTGTVESSTGGIFASEALRSHVARHMKEIALLALQGLPGDEDQNAELYAGSDKPFEDDHGHSVTRKSMDSLLADEALGFQDDNDTRVDGVDYPERGLGEFKDLLAKVPHMDSVARIDRWLKIAETMRGSADSPSGDPASADFPPTFLTMDDVEISARVTELDLEDKDELGMTELHRAVRDGDLDLVEALIQSGASVNCRDAKGATPLHYAAQMGKVKCISVLVEWNGADLRLADHAGLCALLWAVVAGHDDAVDRLLSLGADANTSSADGRSAVAWGAGSSVGSVRQRVRIQTMLLDQGNASLDDARNRQQRTPLGEAAAAGNDILAAMLCIRLADLNHRDRDGWSAIHLAAEEGHHAIVESQLAHGANSNAVSSYGTSPLHCAANGGHFSIVRFLLEWGNADPLKATCHGWTAMHHAAFMGHSDVVGLLLQDDRVRSAASLQDNHGWSVLHLAVHSRDLATVRLLLDTGIIEDPEALVDESGLTAEEWLDRGPTSHAQKAVDNLAFSKSRCCRAVSGLRDAVVRGNVPLVEFLLKSGQDVNGTNSGKRTALYYAAKKSMLSMMDLLLRWGADPNILPTGRKSWEEFISQGDVLRRLKAAGYRRREADADVEREIRRALKERSQLPDPEQPTPRSPDADKSPSLGPDNKPIWRSDGPSSPAPVYEPTLPSPEHIASNELPWHSSNNSSASPIAPVKDNDNKRKASSGRTKWFTRLLGGRQ